MPEKDSDKVIDEAWKRRAQEEKERLAAGGADDAAYAGPPPKPTFAFLVSGLVSQALIGLGQIASPISGKQAANIEDAKFAIDTLQMLQDKTKGNLTDDEKKYLESVLYDLRMRFIDAAG